MKKLIEFPLNNGGSVIIEVEESAPEGGMEHIGLKPGEVTKKATQSFETALDKIKPVTNSIINNLRNHKDSPDEISVEFGLKMTAEAGAIIASAGIEANFKVFMTWKSN